VPRHEPGFRPAPVCGPWRAYSASLSTSSSGTRPLPPTRGATLAGMDRPFTHPAILGDGRTAVLIGSVAEAGSFLVQRWPPRRGRAAYRAAVQACLRALAGTVEPEVARQALIAALEDLAGKPAPSSRQ
jgi:hypothetical protein